MPVNIYLNALPLVDDSVALDVWIRHRVGFWKIKSVDKTAYGLTVTKLKVTKE